MYDTECVAVHQLYKAKCRCQFKVLQDQNSSHLYVLLSIPAKAWVFLARADLGIAGDSRSLTGSLSGSIGRTSSPAGFPSERSCRQPLLPWWAVGEGKGGWRPLSLWSLFFRSDNSGQLAEMFICVHFVFTTFFWDAIWLLNITQLLLHSVPDTSEGEIYSETKYFITVKPRYPKTRAWASPPPCTDFIARVQEAAVVNT